jgi:molybdopterin-containing oxidoreductase family iron-sulfur binding subunit
VFNWYDPQWLGVPRRVSNPDVSRRTVGVVEKCTFCAHRLHKVKEQADLEERPIQDGEYFPACAENCPTDAISFGDIEDPGSEVHDRSRSYRVFRVMDDLGVEPKVYYLAKRTT